MFMQLTEFTDNALRLLIYLGGHRERVATIGEIADRYGVSRHHLAKVSCVLAASGLIETSRGRLGGMRLAGSPRDIRLGEVVRCTERSLAQGAVADDPDDRLQQSLAVATAAYLAELNRVTLADLLAGEEGPQRAVPNWLVPAAWSRGHAGVEGA